MILFLTAMQNIPRDLYDAAKINGANRWQEFRYVTIARHPPYRLLHADDDCDLGIRFLRLRLDI